MPLRRSRHLTGSLRTEAGNRQLGFVLAFVAGAMNAGGYLVVRQYTSHMTGVVSSMADGLVLGSREMVWMGLVALVSFVVGAATTAWLVNFARRRGLHAAYALPLVLEALVLVAFGLSGLSSGPLPKAWLLAPVLCFVMGLQNALITKVSNAEIRTTHVTGMVTDIGIEIGRRVHRLTSGETPPHGARAGRIRLLATLVTCFFVGGVAGALAFEHVGPPAALVLAALLAALAIAPVLDDLAGRTTGPKALGRTKREHEADAR